MQVILIARLLYRIHESFTEWATQAIEREIVPFYPEGASSSWLKADTVSDMGKS
jgi:hypothetical protein